MKEKKKLKKKKKFYLSQLLHTQISLSLLSPLSSFSKEKKNEIKEEESNNKIPLQKINSPTFNHFATLQVPKNTIVFITEKTTNEEKW